MLNTLLVEELICSPPQAIGRAPQPPRPHPEPAPDVWCEVRSEALALREREPFLRSLLDELVLHHATSHEMVLSVVADRLSVAGMPTSKLFHLLIESSASHARTFESCCAADLRAIKTRDPACPSHLHGLLNLKGFHTLVVHRVARSLWLADRRELALWLSNKASLVFGADIHPGAQLGKGLMLDHASGIVIGETAMVGDDVSILQNVTLGGTGKSQGDRHPKVREGVMIGAGATVLGNIEIGTMSKIAAGSVVLHPVPPHCTVAGVPAKVVRQQVRDSCPAVEMNQAI